MKNRSINPAALSAHTRSIFSLSQTIPSSIINLLNQKQKRDLTQKQQKQIYDVIRQRNILPILTHPKIIIQFCSELSIKYKKAGQIFVYTEDCYIILDGAIKIFQQTNKNYSRDGTFAENLRISLNNAINIQQLQHSHRIEKQKIGVGEVLLLDQNQNNLVYIVASAVTLLRIPYHIYSSIALGSFMIQIKKKQEFFNKIPLFQRHYRSSLEDFANCLVQITCGFGRKIITQGDHIQNIYIIKEGQFILQKSVSTDDITIKHGKVSKKKPNETSQTFLQGQIKNISKHYRTCPYKIIGAKQIIGDSQYFHNNKTYMYSMRCHKESSKIYVINAELFFKKVNVSQNGIQRVQQILAQNYEIRKKQIQAGVKFNRSNTLIIRMMQNSPQRFRTQYSNSKQKNINKFTQTIPNANTTQRSHSFFQKMNKTIINPHKNQIRKRNQSRVFQPTNDQKLRKTYKTPAVVQQIVHIVNQKKAYHRLRNIGGDKKNAFQFDINNVPLYIKKKYQHVFMPKKTQ